jgi:hypothetical protein
MRIVDKGSVSHSKSHDQLFFQTGKGLTSIRLVNVETPIEKKHYKPNPCLIFMLDLAHSGTHFLLHLVLAPKYQPFRPPSVHHPTTSREKYGRSRP